MEQFMKNAFKSDRVAHVVIGALSGLIGIVAYRYLPSPVARFFLFAFLCLCMLGVLVNGAGVIPYMAAGATVGFVVHVAKGDAQFRK